MCVFDKCSSERGLFEIVLQFTYENPQLKWILVVFNYFEFDMFSRLTGACNI